jgi:hypothetical protein
MHLPKRYSFCSSLSWFILSFLFPLMVHTYLFFTSLLDTHSGTDLNRAIPICLERCETKLWDDWKTGPLQNRTETSTRGKGNERGLQINWRILITWVHSSEMLVDESMSLSNAIMYGKNKLWSSLLMMSWGPLERCVQCPAICFHYSLLGNRHHNTPMWNPELLHKGR